MVRGKLLWCMAFASFLLIWAVPGVHGQVVSLLTQVNTDASGHDIIGDAANEPSIAVDPNNPNRMAMGWRQFDTVTSNFRQAGVAYSNNGGQTWTRSVLSPGQFGSDPVLSEDASGNFYYASINNDTTFSVVVYKSTNGGVIWSNPVSAGGGDKDWLAIDRTTGPGSGNVYVNWNPGFATVANTALTRSTNGGASFDAPSAGPATPSMWGTMDVGPNGTLYMAASNAAQTGILFSKSTNAQFAGQTPTFTQPQTIPLGGNLAYGDSVNPGGLSGQIWIATDHSQSASRGNIYVLGSVLPTGSNYLQVMFTKSTDDGQTWSSPLRLNNDPLTDPADHWFGMMSVAPNGRIDAIWDDTRNDPNDVLSQLFYAYSLDSGNTWLGNIPVSAQFNSLLGYPNQNKIGDYYDMISDNTGVDIAFSATFTGEQEVYFMRITAVPEPSSLLLVAGAAATAVGMWRRRRRCT